MNEQDAAALMREDAEYDKRERQIKIMLWVGAGGWLCCVIAMVIAWVIDFHSRLSDVLAAVVLGAGVMGLLLTVYYGMTIKNYRLIIAGYRRDLHRVRMELAAARQAE